MDEISLILPPEDIPSVPLRQAELASLLETAFRRTWTFLEAHNPRLMSRVIHRPTDHGWESGYVNIPTVLSGWEGLEEAISSGVAREVTDYLWHHGANRMEVTGPHADKERWIYLSAFAYVFGPLMRYVEDGLVNSLVERVELSSFLPSLDGIPEFALATAEGLCTGQKKVRVVFHHVGLQLEDDLPVEIRPGTRVVPWSRPDYCRFLSLIEEGMESDPWQRLFPGLGSSFVQICFEVPMDTPASDIIGEAVDRVDRFRVALTNVEPRMWCIGERVVYIVVESPFGNREVYRIRRDAQSAWSPLRLNRDIVTNIQRKLDHIDLGLQAMPELRQAVYRFRRACTADVLDDMIVEAVIGLESILVPGAGESRYRFSLHGTALLAMPGEDPATLFKKLAKFYNARSGRVHGAGRRSKDDDKSIEAVAYLARVIEVVIHAHFQGRLPVGSSTAERVEKMVLARVAFAGADDAPLGSGRKAGLTGEDF